ncbi:hypothetical protein O181_130764, partial [Austropuccinia psidii MF-1]|nr:hypothetical protein [Austropuccinia psidii MF-1]
MEKTGFCAEELDKCVYKCTRNNMILFVWMHVDDGVIFSNNQEEIMKLKHELIQHLRIKWEDGLSRIVGIDTTFKHNAIQLSQSRFAKQIVHHFEKKTNSPLIKTRTILPDVKLQTSTDQPVEQKWYQSLIGSLNSLALGTRLDISFAVNYLARYSNSPQQQHWVSLCHLMRYIKYSMNWSLNYFLTNESLN